MSMVLCTVGPSNFLPRKKESNIDDRSKPYFQFSISPRQSFFKVLISKSSRHEKPVNKCGGIHLCTVCPIHFLPEKKRGTPYPGLPRRDEGLRQRNRMGAALEVKRIHCRDYETTTEQWEQSLQTRWLQRQSKTPEKREKSIQTKWLQHTGSNFTESLNMLTLSWSLKALLLSYSLSWKLGKHQ